MANEPAPQLAIRPLFGGAIAMSLPVNYGDARYVIPLAVWTATDH